MNSDSKSHDAITALTDKQRAVLDLLVQHKTSKEIARVLGISPYTVDQRIAAARKKFGAETRNELASVYMQTSGVISDADVYQRSVYHSSQVEIEGAVADRAIGFGTKSDVPSDTHEALDRENRNLPVAYHRVVPESFEGRYGFIWRIAAIVGITLMLLFAILAGFAMFGQLSDMLR